MNIHPAPHSQHQGGQSEMGCDRYQGELEERDQENKAGNQDESRDLRVGPSQDTELHWLCGSPEVLRRIISTISITNRKQRNKAKKLLDMI